MNNWMDWSDVAHILGMFGIALTICGIGLMSIAVGVQMIRGCL